MRAARLRGAALAGAVGLVLLSSSYAAAEPLRLVAAAASVAFDARTGKPVLTIRLADESKQSFAAFSQAHVGQMIDTRIDGKTVLKPVMREPIPGGSLQVTMDSVEEARRLADRLSSGATALEVEAVSN
jgi:preprotein translocase subunit SecD